MNILIVDINPNLISTNETLFPEKQSCRYVYEHLLYYYSKSKTQLATIEVMVFSNSIVVVSRHIYLAIAKELKLPNVRAYINPLSEEHYIQSLLKNNAVNKLDWDELRKEENEKLVGYNWYIFFFDKFLNIENKQIFENKVISFFENIPLPNWSNVTSNRILDINYPFDSKCAEFQAYVPFLDERWYANSLEVLANFHHKQVPIVSFQGSKFMF